MSWSKEQNKAVKLTKEDMDRELRGGNSGKYSIDFLVGKPVKIKPFGLNGTIVGVGDVKLFDEDGSFNCGYDKVKYYIRLDDGTNIVTLPYLELQLFGYIPYNITDMVDGISGEFVNRKICGKFEKVYISNGTDKASYTSIVVYDVAIENNIAMIKFGYTKLVKGEQYKSWYSDALRTEYSRSNYITKVKIPLRDFNKYVNERIYDMMDEKHAEVKSGYEDSIFH